MTNLHQMTEMHEQKFVQMPDFDMHVLERVLRIDTNSNDPIPLTEKQIAADIQGYREFLFRHKLAGMPELPEIPPIHIDRVWHIHMCQTRLYAENCQGYFGKFIHHASLICHGGNPDGIVPKWSTRPDGEVGAH